MYPALSLSLLVQVSMLSISILLLLFHLFLSFLPSPLLPRLFLFFVKLDWCPCSQHKYLLFLCLLRIILYFLFSLVLLLLSNVLTLSSGLASLGPSSPTFHLIFVASILRVSLYNLLAILCSKSTSPLNLSLLIFFFFWTSSFVLPHFTPFLNRLSQHIRYPSVESFARTHYPSHPWEHEKFVHSHVKAVYTPQLFMARIVRSIFPNKEVAMNLRAPLGIMGEHGKPLEIDVFVPELSLGFEYQVFSNHVYLYSLLLFFLIY